MSEDSRTDGGPVTPKDSDAASIESNAKEVVVMHTQKEHLPDPDLLPQAVYPRGLPAWIELRRPGDGPPTPVIVVDMRRPLESSGQEQSRDGSINFDSPVIAVRHYYPEGATSLSGSTVSDSASVAASSSNGTGPKIIILDKEAGGDIGSDAASEEARSRNESSTKAQRKILGFRRRTFWICFGFLALLVIGGIVGGVVGGIIASNDMARRPIEAIAPATNQTSSLRLADTRIAAANWTTAEGRVYSALFTQDPTGAISMSRWDQAAKRWTVTNVTQKVLDNGFTGFAAKLGTPMAAISTGPPVYDFEMRLYYVGLGDNVLVEVMTQDPTAQNWTMGEYRRVAPRVVSPTSDLSAAWVRCGTCNDEIHVMYTDRRNFINLVNSSDWQRLHNAIGPRPGGGFLVHPQTSMLVMPALRFNTTTNTTEPEGVAGMFNTGIGIDPTAKVDDTFDTSPPKTTRLRVGVHNGTMWRDGGLEEPAGEFYPGEITDVRRQLVGIPYDDYRKAIVFYLIANGTLVGYQMTYNATIPSWQRDVPIKIVGGPAASLKIKSIAMTWTKQVFALTSMGIVEEYRWTPDDPFTIMYEGPVIHKADLVSVPIKAR